MILALAFAVIFLTAVFLFMRNYPSDRWFSVVFVVAGGVMAWCAWGTEAGAGIGATEDKIECFYDKPATTIDATNEPNGSNAGQEQEGTERGGERMGEDEGK